MNDTINKAIQELILEKAIAVDKLTREQLAEAFLQACQSGDFVRHVRMDGGQSVTYIPYREVETAQLKIKKLREALIRCERVFAAWVMDADPHLDLKDGDSMDRDAALSNLNLVREALEETK